MGIPFTDLAETLRAPARTTESEEKNRESGKNAMNESGKMGIPFTDLAETLRARARITALSVRLPWSNGVVPLAVEVGGFDFDGGHLGFGDLDALVVDILIEPARDS